MGAAEPSAVSPSLGRLLEIALRVEQPADALAAFSALGLRDVPVTDFAPGPRAVVSDGHFAIGLHVAEIEGPMPTFVRPGLREHLLALEGAGIRPIDADLGEDRFHRATFCDPNDLHVALIEARTFAPVEPAPGLVPVCGRFAELSIATHSLEESAAFWRALGFTAAAAADTPHPSARLIGHGLTIGLHETSRFKSALTFTAPQLDARIEYLRAKSFTPRTSSPLTAGSARSATLAVPGGVPFFMIDPGDDRAGADHD